MRTFTLTAAIVALSALAGGCGSSAPEHPSVEYRAAKLDGTKPSGNDDAALVPYRDELRRLRTICTDSKQRLLEQARAAQKQLNALLISWSLLAILRETRISAVENRSAPRPRPCAGDLASAVTALEQNGS